MNRLNAQKELELLFNDLPKFIDEFDEFRTPIVFNLFTFDCDTIYIRKDKKGYHLCYSGLHAEKIKQYNNGVLNDKNNGYFVIKSINSLDKFDDLKKLYKKFVRFLVWN